MTTEATVHDMSKDQQPVDLEDVRARMNKIGEELQGLHIGAQMHDVITMGLLCLLARTHLLQYGLFGNNKSRVITDIMKRVTDIHAFVLGASAFSTKGDLVGSLDMKALDEGKHIYKTEGMFPESDVAFLDEVLEMGNALVKELHAPMNERRFSNGGKWVQTPTISVFGATNVDPDDAIEGKAAFLDRWHLRIKVGYPQSREAITAIRELNRKLRKDAAAGKTTKKTTITKHELLAAQKEVLDIEVPKEVDDTVYKIQKKLYQEGGILQSPRRLTFVDPIVQASAWMRGNSTVDLADLAILKYAFWHRYEDIETVDRVMAVEAKSHISQSNELLKDIERVYKQFQDLSKGDPKRGRLKAQVSEKVLKLSRMRDEFEKQGKDPTVIERAYDKAQRIQHNMVRNS